jgi:hypothetical protein
VDAKMDAKNRGKWQKIQFLTEYLFKNAKNGAFMHFFLHKCLIFLHI